MIKSISKIMVLLSSSLLLLNTKVKADDIYMLGDSRFVGMQQVDKSENHKYYAEVGKGLSYLENYFNQIQDKVTENDKIVINFGVNDLENIDKYINCVNAFAGKTDAKIYYMTVNPVNEIKERSHGYNVKAKTVNSFNNKLKLGLNKEITILDSNQYLVGNTYSTRDGIHYTNDTYKDILKFINENII